MVGADKKQQLKSFTDKRIKYQKMLDFAKNKNSKIKKAKDFLLQLPFNKSKEKSFIILVLRSRLSSK